MKKFLIMSALMLSSVDFAYAQEVIYKLATPLPGGEPTVKNFTDYAQYLFPFLLSVASILALVMFTLGAIQYMFSDGGEGNKDGKDKMTNAILGLLLAAGSVLLLETINPKLITLEIDIERRNGTDPGGGPTPDAGGFLLGLFGGDSNDTKISVPQKPLCGDAMYGECPSENACRINPVGDYYCVRIARTVCPRGAECTPCSQVQLEQCIKNNQQTSSCIVAQKSSGNTTICSHE
ncbi:MAG: pilin [Patescibacteria group bacterium]